MVVIKQNHKLKSVYIIRQRHKCNYIFYLKNNMLFKIVKKRLGKYTVYVYLVLSVVSKEQKDEKESVSK